MGDWLLGNTYKNHSHFLEYVDFTGVVAYVAPTFLVNVTSLFRVVIHVDLNETCEVIGNIYENPELVNKLKEEYL